MPRKKGDVALNMEEIEKAKALSALGRSFRAIAAELHKSPHTVKKVLTGSAQVVEEVKARKADLAELFEERSRQTLDAVTPGDIEKASLLQKATSSAIFLDKARLLKGESTLNVSVDVLLGIAKELRREERAADELLAEKPERVPVLPAPVVVERVLPAPVAEPKPAPQPAKQEPVAAMRVKYTEVLAGKHPDHCPPENPLLRGLRMPGSRE